MTFLVFLCLAVVLVVACGGVAFLTTRLERTSGDRLRKRCAVQPLAHELPYWAFFEHETLGISVHVDGTYTGHLELHGLDTDCMDDEKLHNTSQSLHGVLQNLPPGAVLQLVHATDGDVTEMVNRFRARIPHTDAMGRVFLEAKAQHLLQHGGLRRTRLALAVSYPNPARRSLLPAAHFPSLTPEEHTTCVRGLQTLCDQVARALQVAGVRARPMAVPEVRELAYALLNPSRSRLVGAPRGREKQVDSRSVPVTWCEDQSAREQLLFSGVSEKRDHLLHDRHMTRVITLRLLPTGTWSAMLERLLVELSFHCRVAFAVEMLDTVGVVKSLKRRRDQAHLFATLREKRNQEAERQEEDLSHLIDKLLASSSRVVRLSLSVVVSVDTREEDPHALLDQQTAEVVRAIQALQGAEALIEEYSQLDEFLATLPGNSHHGLRWHQCTSENAAHLFLAWQHWAGSLTPALLVQNGRGNLVGLDPFSNHLDNLNAFIAGTSGSGKSTTMNYYLINLLATGVKALIIDVGGSYRRTLEIFGGAYISVSERSGLSLNPFFTHEELFQSDDQEDHERRFQLLMAVFERMLQDIDRPELRLAERALLAHALRQTYQTVVGRTPILADLVEVLRRWTSEDPADAEIARRFVRDLGTWLGTSLINRPSSLRLTCGLAAFDLKGLEHDKNLSEVVMLILAGVIWNLVMRDRSEKKVVVFDECWTFLSSPSSAKLIASLYRTSRKYRCGVVALSQGVEDFTNSPIAGALVGNSATRYLLRHSEGHDTVGKIFRLNAREVEVFRGLEMRRGVYTESLVCHGDQHFLARIALTPLEYWIATTHPMDLAVEQRVQKENPYLSRLELLRLLSERYPHGAPDDAACVGVAA